MHLFTMYGWLFTGTTTTTDKKQREDYDFPFLKLSKGALNELPRGWFREAVLQLKTNTGKPYCIQATTWRDKKQVNFLSSEEIGASVGLSVKRSSKKKKRRATIAAPRVQKSYSKKFSAVDKNDRDGADWSTTFRSVRYYLRMFCWMLDRVVHACYVIVCYLAAAGQGRPEWRKYLKRNNGRHDFQIDLGMALINRGIELDWKEGKPRPKWMRQRDLVPPFWNSMMTAGNIITRAKPARKEAAE